MHVDHPNTEIGSSTNGFGDGYRNIVKFKIEKNLEAARMSGVNRSGTTCGKQFFTNFYAAKGRVELVQQSFTGG